MKKRIRKKLEKQGRLLSQQPIPVKYKDYFPFERLLVRAYKTVQNVDPSHPLLIEGCIDPTDHFEFSPGRWHIQEADSEYFKINPVPIAGQEYDSVKRYILKMNIAASRLERCTSNP